jgi:aspartate aminotransferase
MVDVVSLLSSSIKKINPSPTVAMLSKAKELKAQGIDVLSLSIGESDFDTPDNIKKAAHEAIKAGKTKYTPVDGISELKNAILNKYQNRLNLNLNNIIVSSGAKQVIYNCFIATIEEDDEVIIPAPYWVSYPDMVKIARGKPVVVECKEKSNFKLTPDLLESAITKRSKWLILNSPNNPTGMKYSKNELKALAEAIKKYPNLHVLSDDIYESMVFDNEVYSLIDVAPELADRIFIINGVSKTYAMTGWRIGYGIGSEEVIKAMKTVQSQSTSNPCSISQYASVEALNGDQSFVSTCVRSFQKRRDLACGLLNEIDGITCIEPQGAFYLFSSCEDLLGKKTSNGTVIKDSYDFCEFLIEQARVIVIPGNAFGMNGYFRFSYAVSEEQIKEAIKRIKTACSSLQKN